MFPFLQPACLSGSGNAAPPRAPPTPGSLPADGPLPRSDPRTQRGPGRPLSPKWPANQRDPVSSWQMFAKLKREREQPPPRRGGNRPFVTGWNFFLSGMSPLGGGPPPTPSPLSYQLGCQQKHTRAQRWQGRGGGARMNHRGVSGVRQHITPLPTPRPPAAEEERALTQRYTAPPFSPAGQVGSGPGESSKVVRADGRAAGRGAGAGGTAHSAGPSGLGRPRGTRGGSAAAPC